MANIFDRKLPIFFQKVFPKEIDFDFLFDVIDGFLDFRQFGHIDAIRNAVRHKYLARRDFLCLDRALHLQTFDAGLDNERQSHFVVSGEVVYNCIDEKIHFVRRAVDGLGTISHL